MYVSNPAWVLYSRHSKTTTKGNVRYEEVDAKVRTAGEGSKSRKGIEVNSCTEGDGTSDEAGQPFK